MPTSFSTTRNSVVFDNLGRDLNQCARAVTRASDKFVRKSGNALGVAVFGCGQGLLTTCCRLLGIALSLISHALQRSAQLIRRAARRLAMRSLVLFHRFFFCDGPEADACCRLRAIQLGMLLLVFLVTFRLFDIQSSQHLKWMTLASKQHDSKVEILGARGTVLDRSGRILATSVDAASVGVNPKFVTDAEESSSRLATMLSLEKSELLQLLKTKKGFTWLSRGLPLEYEDRIVDAGLPGVSTIRESRRFYPQGTIAASILGRVGRDGVGQSGIEKQFNNHLLAPSITLAVRRDARGRLVTDRAWQDFAEVPDLNGGSLSSAVSSFFSPKSAEADELIRHEGKPIQLTIDTLVQSILEEEFETARKAHNAKRVFGLVMDADTGEILGAAQNPGFNPNQLENVTSEQLRNIIAQDSFEPGSTLKPLVAAVGLEEKVVSLNEVMDCESGKLKIGKYTIRDVHPVAVVPFSQVIIRSSNICMAKVGFRLGKQRLHAALEKLGFGRETGVELAGEAKGILRNGRTWAEIDVATHSFGQGVSVTSLQMARAYAAIANGGYLVEPTLLLSRQSAKERILSERATHQLQEALLGVTEDEHGTGKQAAIPGVRVYGKTGTAQKARIGHRGYDPTRILSSFIGFVDGKDAGVNRKLVMLVAVDEPKGKVRYGGLLAAPVFSKAMGRILSHMINSEPFLQRAAVDSSETAAGNVHS